MTKFELKTLFNNYLHRNFTENEWVNHGNKDVKDFESELLGCYEYKQLIANKTNGLISAKKIAIVLSGHIRNCNIIDSLNNLHRHYDIDVFIHTWDTIGIKGNETNFNDNIRLEIIKNKLDSIINLKDYLIENNVNFLNSIKSETESMTYFNYSSDEIFIKSQLYSVKKSYELLDNYSKENDITYDCVIKSRFDLSFINFLLDDYTINDINNHDLIFVTNKDEHFHADYGSSCWACDNMYYKFNLKSVHYFDHTNVICDVFAYGSQNSMKKYCQTYDDYDSINQSFISGNLDVIEKTNIKVNKINNQYQFLPKDNIGHIETLYYVDCSYPERILQKRLKDFMIIESNKIKIKFHR